MNTQDQKTPYGYLRVLDSREIHLALRASLEEATRHRVPNRPAPVALAGGSTPKAFFRWLARNPPSPQILRQVVWYTGDERDVPRSDPESNFGTADRLLLDPLGVLENRRVPWATELPPPTAARIHNETWERVRGREAGFSLVFLGMGDDGHTLSLFPGSPLLREAGDDGPFAAVEVPGKGWRLTLTPSGLMRAARVVVCVTGESKAERLREVMQGGYDPLLNPIQVLKPCAARAIWLVDSGAARLLG